MAPKREINAFLEAGGEDESDIERGSDDGYDSEAAELGKGHRNGDLKTRSKRRKMDSEDEESDQESVIEDDSSRTASISAVPTIPVAVDGVSEDKNTASAGDVAQEQDSLEPSSKHITKLAKSLNSTSKPKKESRPGIIYLPSLPPHLKPSALKNLLQQRGFSPVTRLFLTPSTLSKGSGGKSRARKTFSEGWVEFGSHKTAKRCVQTLNASPIGGPKRGYYHDDLWNMRYLRGMSWSDLMGQIQEERRESEVRKTEERRIVKREVEQFLQGVELSKKEKTRQEKEKRRQKDDSDTIEEETSISEKQGSGKGKVGSSFQWKQFQVKEQSKSKGGKDGHNSDGPAVDVDTKRILGKIF